MKPAASTLAFVAMLTSVSLADEIKAPVGSFTEPTMLPVGDAQIVGANINTNAQNRVNATENVLDALMAGLRRKSLGIGVATVMPMRDGTPQTPKYCLLHVVPDRLQKL